MKERRSPRDRIYITTVQFSLPQQSKDWSTVRTIYRWNFRESTWRRITFYSGGSTSQGMRSGASPCEPTISLKVSYKCFRLPHLSFTKWHLETLHALMSLKLSCLPAQPLAPCICSFLELLFYLSLLVTNSNKMVSMMEIHGDQCSEVIISTKGTEASTELDNKEWPFLPWINFYKTSLWAQGGNTLGT